MAPARTLTVAQLRGFCAGVVRAVDIVETALELCGTPLYVRKEIIHNATVVGSLRAKGVVFVDSLAEVPEGRTVIFSAHGVSPAVWDEAKSRRLQVIDATCPLVTKVHMEALQFAKQGKTIFLIGHRDHDEVIGTLGEAPASIRVVGSVVEARTVAVPDPARVAVITQTTLSVDDTRAILAALKERFPALALPKKDDICYATQNRQDAVKALAPRVDLLLVLGSPNSSNSVRLCEVSEAAGTPARLIERASDIRPEWLEGVFRLGLTASASAPENLVQEVIAWCREKAGVASVEESVTVAEDVRFAPPPELQKLVAQSAAH
jgi:4-hydroxy-3-methylbut-2-enyl diphosphate reductase